MNKRLDEIQERCKRGYSHSAQSLEDVEYLLSRLKPHPASDPPVGGRLVIVRWGDRVSLGEYVQGAWYVQGWSTVTDYHCPVETWQELSQ